MLVCFGANGGPVKTDNGVHSHVLTDTGDWTFFFAQHNKYFKNYGDNL